MREFRVQAIGPSGDCAVLQVTGEVDLYTAPILRERILGLAATGTVHIIIDLGHVDFLDSSGLAALVGGLRRLRADGGSLTPVISTKPVLRIFQITGLTRALAPQPTVPDAITADPHWRRTAERQAGSVQEWCRQHGLS